MRMAWCWMLWAGDWRQFTRDFLARSQHPIYELEIFPVLVAFRTWKRHLSNSQVIFYLDNDAARSALIRTGWSTELSQVIMAEFVKLEKDTRVLPWSQGFPTPATRQLMPPDWCLTPRGSWVFQSLHCPSSSVVTVGYVVGAASKRQSGNW